MARGPRAHRAARWRLLAPAVLIGVFYLAVGVFDHDLWSPTEPAVAGVVWNMVDRGGLAVPRIDDFPYLEKPPLYDWVAWLACRAGGRLDAGLLRLPASLFGLGALALLGWSVGRRHGPRVASVVALVAATTWPLWQTAHCATPDAAALFFAFLAFALFERTLAGPGAPALRRTWPWDLALAATLAASFYAKNLFVAYVVAPPIACFLLARRAFRRLALVGSMAVLLTALCVAPWARALYREGGSEYLRVVFVDNTLGRWRAVPPALQPPVDRLDDAYSMGREPAPAWLYLAQLPLNVAPWSLVFLAACAGLLRRPRDDRTLFLALALLTVPAALTLSASRSPTYLEPLLFVQLLVVADWLAEHFAGETTRPWERRLYGANLALVGAAAVLLPAAAGVALGRPALVGWSFACAAGGAAWMWRQRRGWAGARATEALGVLAVLAAGGGLALAMPALDARRSSAAFFQAIERDAAGRTLYTTLADDRRLPLVTWYLRAAVPVIEARRQTLGLLRGAAPVGIVMGWNEYERWRRRIEAVGATVDVAPSGKQHFVFVSNAARRDSLAPPNGPSAEPQVSREP